MPFIIVSEDIPRMRVDAIVNAANSSLLGGGGVDGAIHRAAGPELLEYCRGLHGCETGEAKSTPGFRLPAKYVIHTVGPVWMGGGRGEEALLRSCYANSLLKAEKLGCETVAFPLISSGVYGYPKREAAAVAISAVREFLETHEMTVYLSIFGDRGIVADGALVSEVESAIARPPRESAPFRPDAVMGAAYSRPAELQDASEAKAERPKPFALWRRQHKARESAAANACEPAHYEAREEADEELCEGYRPDGELEEWLRSLDEGFSRNLLRRIDASGMTDAECYKRANIDRKLFSKIRSDENYRPSKPTAVAFAIALRLDLPSTLDLLRRAGLTLSRSNRFDMIIEYFITHGRYDIYEINETLFAFDQPLLGR